MPFGWRQSKTECDWVRPRLSEYVDSQLADEDRRRVDTHLEGCLSCSEDLASLRDTIDLLHRLPVVPVPRSFTITTPQVVPQMSLSPVFYYLRNATAAVAVVFIALMAGSLVLEQSASMPSAAPFTFVRDQGQQEQLWMSGDNEVDTLGGATDTVKRAAPGSSASTAVPLEAPAAPVPAAAPPADGVRGFAEDGPVNGAEDSTQSKSAAEPVSAATGATAAGSPESMPEPLAAASEGFASAETDSEAAPADQVEYDQMRSWAVSPWSVQVIIGGVLMVLMLATGVVWLRERGR